MVWSYFQRGIFTSKNNKNKGRVILNNIGWTNKEFLFYVFLIKETNANKHYWRKLLLLSKIISMGCAVHKKIKYKNKGEAVCIGYTFIRQGKTECAPN